MYKLLPIFAFLAFVSCTETKDCSECEKKLYEITSNQLTPVDLPDDKPDHVDAADFFMTVAVTADDKYVLDDKEYSFEDLTSLVHTRLSTDESSNGKLKIAGHKKAHYEAIFQLMALSLECDLDPVFVYSGE